ncbi:hypothetical protein CERZMDRAFT_80883 [Cercospora zeae-maydis SCOH1-5]|uniref:RING-type domain-containing protein n=1 Tax=Cercospora zeae-maydis SCOH1-5 TaxID=717836 RepID=A0A6A6FU04_9PEZI|nr:hypothetical protein CERZMDRAFT_80883 [Cercospora zeae-maydis SCOH1-5]
MSFKKECPVCRSHLQSFKSSPSTCFDQETKQAIRHGDDQRACSECWELYLSMRVEERAAVYIESAGDHMTNIECMFCPSPLTRAGLKQLSHIDTINRYDMKQIQATRRKCQARCQGTDTPFQNFDRVAEGRIFTCQNCSLATCVDCDRPEHTGETCTQYQHRILCDPVRLIAEAATQNDARLPDAKVAGYCSNCKVPFENIKNDCGYTICWNDMAQVPGGCGFRFWSGCHIPWVGEGSAYLGGRAQHLPSCKHHFQLCKSCNRKEHPDETCEKYLVRLRPIADAEDANHKSAPGEKHWETGHATKKRFEMSLTYLEREQQRKERQKNGCKRKAAAE